MVSEVDYLIQSIDTATDRLIAQLSAERAALAEARQEIAELREVRRLAREFRDACSALIEHLISPAGPDFEKRGELLAMAAAEARDKFTQEVDGE